MIVQLQMEVDRIQHNELRQLVTGLLEQAHGDFWLQPASRTGKYHSIQSLGPEGLIRHIRMACYFADRFMRVYAVEDQYEMDLVFAAILLHDICKPDELKKEHEAYVPHELQAARRVRNAGGPTQLCELVEHHMGIWSHDKPDFMQLSKLEQIVHLADYASAQRCVIVDFLSGIKVEMESTHAATYKCQKCDVTKAVPAKSFVPYCCDHLMVFQMEERA